MTEESDGSFLFRRQFDVTAKRILCHREKKVLSDFLAFLEKHNRYFLVSIEEETLAIIQSKLQESFPDRFQTLKIKGFTYWKRSLRKLDIPHFELEDKSSSTFCDALTIAKVLSTRFLRLHSIEFSMYHHCLSIKKLKSPHQHRVKSCKEEIVIDISSFRNISSCIKGRKKQQIFLDSDSETDDICEKVDERTKNSIETPEYFELDNPNIKCEKIVISSDSEDDKDVNPKMITTDPLEKDPWTKCCICECRIKQKNLEKHFRNVHCKNVYLKKKMTESNPVEKEDSAWKKSFEEKLKKRSIGSINNTGEGLLSGDLGEGLRVGKTQGP